MCRMARHARHGQARGARERQRKHDQRKYDVLRRQASLEPQRHRPQRQHQHQRVEHDLDEIENLIAPDRKPGRAPERNGHRSLWHNWKLYTRRALGKTSCIRHITGKLFPRIGFYTSLPPSWPSPARGGRKIGRPSAARCGGRKIGRPSAARGGRKIGQPSAARCGGRKIGRPSAARCGGWKID